MARKIKTLAVMVIMLVASVIVRPSRAYALTGIPGYYLDESAAVCGVCGYNYETMQPTVRSWLFNSTADGGVGSPPDNPNYPSFAAFRDTVRESVFGGAFNQFTGEVGNGYYSTVDGALYVSMKETAKQDIENALAQYAANHPSSGGGGPTGNTQNGDNVRIQLVKSFSTTGYLSSSIMYDGTRVGFGPANSSDEMSPESIYIDVPNTVIQSVRNTISGDFKLIAMVTTTNGVNLMAFASNQVDYEWTDIDLVSGNVTYPVRCLNEYRSANAIQYWYVFNLNSSVGVTDVIEFPSNPRAGQNSMGANPNTYQYNGVYVSAVPYDGTFTPQPEPEPEAPTGPQITIPDVPDEPTGPDTTGNAAPTVDNRPITDRLDTIIDQIADFEQLFWSYYNSVVSMWSNLWDMLDYWLGLIEFNTRSTYGMLQTIYYKLDNINNEITETNNYFIPVISNGNTVQQQLQQDAQQLKTKFPMSLPWDLLAVLMLLEAPPHSMVFDVPIAYFSTVQTIHIDLSEYEVFYAACRAISLWAFAWWLILKTKDLFIELGN